MEPQACTVIVQRIWCSVKSFKNIFMLLCWDANAVVFYLDRKKLIFNCCDDLNFVALLRIFKCIADEIGKYTPQQVLIHLYRCLPPHMLIVNNLFAFPERFHFLKNLS